MSALVLDVGGTTIRGAAHGPAGLRVVRRPAPGFAQNPGLDAPGLIRAFLVAVSDIALELGIRPRRIALGFPGPTDEDGRVWKAPTLWGERVTGPVELRSLLGGLWPTAELHVVNDVTGAGYGYLRRPDESLCVVTVSTGIGHKVFVRGKPAVGANGRGGELGHLRVDFSEDAPLCDCGGRGHLGALSSGRAVARQALGVPGAPPSLSPEDLAAAYPHASWAYAVADRLARPLGRALAAVHVDTGVERFVLLGGLGCALGRPFALQVAHHASRACWDTGQDWCRMVEVGEPDSVLQGLFRMLEICGKGCAGGAGENKEFSPLEAR